MAICWTLYMQFMWVYVGDYMVKVMQSYVGCYIWRFMSPYLVVTCCRLHVVVFVGACVNWKIFSHLILGQLPTWDGAMPYCNTYVRSSIQSIQAVTLAIRLCGIDKFQISYSPQDQDRQRQSINYLSKLLTTFSFHLFPFRNSIFRCRCG